MTGKDLLIQHGKELELATGLKVEVFQEGDTLFVVLHKYRLPSGVCKIENTDVLFMADTQYPISAMDMFWTEMDVLRPDGSMFENSDAIQSYLGRNWRRFSYHRNSIWNHNGNPLMDHFAFMETRWTGRAKT